VSRRADVWAGAVWVVSLWFVMSASWVVGGEASASHRVPPNVLPVLGCWFWTETEFQPGGYRDFLDKVAAHSSYDLLTTSIRAPLKEVTDDDVRAQIAEATAYARKLGLGVAMDLDVRLARKAFQTAYPDELQEMLRLREFELRDAGEVTALIASSDLGDHYTFRTTHYVPLSERLLRVYTYVLGPNGIDAGTVEDITAKGAKVLAATAREVRVAIPCGEATKGWKACVVAAFTHFTPDVFAPHLLEFQRAILRRYADCGLAGACKASGASRPATTAAPRPRPDRRDHALLLPHGPRPQVGRRRLVQHVLRDSPLRLRARHLVLCPRRRADELPSRLSRSRGEGPQLDLGIAPAREPDQWLDRPQWASTSLSGSRRCASTGFRRRNGGAIG